LKIKLCISFGIGVDSSIGFFSSPADLKRKPRLPKTLKNELSYGLG
jgi:hypothetical protein